MKHLQVCKLNDGHSYAVLVDGEICSRLTIDEAIGCVASAFFREKPMFCQPLADWINDPRGFEPIEEKLAILEAFGISATAEIKLASEPEDVLREIPL